MKVKTLHPDEFNSHARRLSEMLRSEHPGVFDAIIGIKTGGSIVCDALCNNLPSGYYLCRSDISLQRPSTKRKKGIVKKLLRGLPLPVLDGLRIGESILLEMINKTSHDAIPSVVIEEKLQQILLSKDVPEILLVDDAVDSGNTILSIKNAIAKINPNTKILSAVFTVTTSNPKTDAEFSLYRNRTLIRFPWSNDYKKT